MFSVSRKIVQSWVNLGPRFLPFADAASPELPLSRLLRLSLFQVSVGMALVLLVGTLNRVMIVEMGVPAALVAVMIALPVLFAPFRALVGFRSDNHKSALGWRRVPYMWRGTLLQFGGLAVMPFAILVLSGGGNASQWPAWIGPAAAGVAFLLVGAGLHTTQTAGLALATDLAPEATQPKVVGLMYVMLLLGSVVSSLVFGALLEDYSPGRLVQVIQGAAVVTLVLNAVALWKQETRRPPRGAVSASAAPNFNRAWLSLLLLPHARRRLLVIGLGTLAFGMQDVLLEPYGGQFLGMSVSQTTLLTATLACGGLLGFTFASVVLSRGRDAMRVAAMGVALGVPAFALVVLSGPLASVAVFVLGVFGIGLAGGLFSHGTLTAAMNSAPPDQAGLALGSWGAMQATAAGVGVALGGVLADSVANFAGRSASYDVVYLIEIGLLLATFWAMSPLIKRLPMR
jgi:BCD family chlorophyll transporter-like MFS transporter